MIDHRAAAGEQTLSSRRVRLRVQDPQQREVIDLPIELETGRQTSASFLADDSGVFTATLLGAGDRVLASRLIHVRDMAAELVSTSRNMETLRQFAGISGGLAIEADSGGNVAELLGEYLQREEPPKVEVAYALPAGINGWTLAVLLACISAEWLCRKQWEML